MNEELPQTAFRPNDHGSDCAYVAARMLAERRMLHGEKARRMALQGLLTMAKDEEGLFAAALHEDMGRSGGEAWTSELVSVHDEAKHALKNLRRWMKPDKVRTPLKLMPSSSFVLHRPKGAVLIIGTWNLPVTVCLGPVVGALAAGNAVVLKPSELAPASAEVMAQLLPRYCGKAVKVVTGGPEATAALLKRAWDHIFFTGGTRVGRIVAEAAARQLTPVTLELGGRCAAYVHHSADLEVAAKRLAWGKWMNAGQVCIAPNHVFVDKEIAQPFLGHLRAAVRAMYGDDPSSAADYARIVNRSHFDRIAGLFEGSGGEIVLGGGHDRQALFFGPTAVLDPDPGSALMGEEIFGPVLPVVRVSSHEEALARIAEAPPPLALYPFAKDQAVRHAFEEEGRAGAVVTNDVTVNHGVRDLPFGGVGESGHGVCHGVHGFRTFSIPKAIMRRPTWTDPNLRYPPFTDKKIKLMKRLG